MTLHEKFNEWAKKSAEIAQDIGIKVEFTSTWKYPKDRYDCQSIPIIIVTDEDGNQVTLDGDTTFSVTM